MRIDGLQYANWSETVFRQMREGGVDAVHVTVAYHEGFRETVLNIEAWNRWFERFPDLILHGRSADEIDLARETGRTAIFFGFQNMQLSYNNQSLLATGCYETTDAGITRMGRQVIREMNRVGMVVDMSHSADRSTIEAADLSSRPIAITHANPHRWAPALRNKRDDVIRAVTGNGGMIGFSLYPHHLKDKSACTLRSFCEMVARAADSFGVDHLGIGSDLCQDQPDSVVEWMRVGRWSKEADYGEGSAEEPGFPPMPEWFRDNRDFGNLERGLRDVGMDEDEVAAIMGGNWYRFFADSFGRAG